jgi:hypothetical protein
MRNLLAHALSSDLSHPELPTGERARKAADRVLRDGFWQSHRASVASVVSLDAARAKRRARSPR